MISGYNGVIKFKLEKRMISYSWEIVDDNVAIKQTDTSVFRYYGTGIPKDTKWFWGIEELAAGEKMNISLKYQEVIYNAVIQIDSSKSLRARMYWQKDFLEAIGYLYNHFNQKLDQYPKIKFLRSGLQQYDIEIIKKDTTLLIEENVTFEEIQTNEGKKLVYYTTRYERDPKLRKAAIKIHGLQCHICGFDFSSVYGILGEGYIEVHHKKPLHSLDEEVLIDPKEDLITVCANCHRILHRHRDKIITVDELKDQINNR